MYEYPDVKTDQLIKTQELDWIIDIPAFNWEKLCVDASARFHYNTKLYLRQNGSIYYIFDEMKGCSLFIMDVKKAIYDIIKQHIQIDDITEIWNKIPEDDDFYLVPFGYRKIEGTGIKTFVIMN